MRGEPLGEGGAPAGAAVEVDGEALLMVRGSGAGGRRAAVGVQPSASAERVVQSDDPGHDEKRHAGRHGHQRDDASGYASANFYGSHENGSSPGLAAGDRCWFQVEAVPPAKGIRPRPNISRHPRMGWTSPGTSLIYGTMEYEAGDVFGEVARTARVLGNGSRLQMLQLLA
ncbi:MAG: hypothetical protein WC184_02185 [Acidimicrobiia bacterium]